MARVHSPLFSLDARGSIARAVTYSRTIAGHVAKRLAPQPNVRSVAQLQHRAIYRNACNEWNSFTPEQRAAWVGPADQLRLTGFNAYLQNYLVTHYPPWPTTPEPLNTPSYRDGLWMPAISFDGHKAVGSTYTPESTTAYTVDVRNLPQLLPHLPEHIDCGPNAVSINGNIVAGWAGLPAAWRPCYWIDEDMPVFLEILPDTIAATVTAIDATADQFTTLRKDATQWEAYIQGRTGAPVRISPTIPDQQAGWVTLSEDGNIAAGYSWGDIDGYGWRWTRGIGAELLSGPPGSSWFTIGNISGDGTTIPGSYYDGEYYWACYWTDLTNPVLLDVPPSTVYAYGQAANRDGSRILSNSHTDGKYRTYLTTIGGPTIELAQPDGSLGTYPVAMSGDGTTGTFYSWDAERSIGFVMTLPD